MIQIGERAIGEGSPPYFIADIAANHDGSIDRAFRLIELAKESGADAAKFQNFTADKIVSDSGFRAMGGQVGHQAAWGKSVYQVYTDASLPANWTPRLKERCVQVGIEYMTSPYDLVNLELADQYVNAIKIGSGDITWPGMLRRIAAKGKPVLLATGASSMEDVRRAVSLFNPDALVLMQCNTNYTPDVANFRHVNLRVLENYKREFPGVVLGLSDHTPGHAAVLGAIALGAVVIEKHFTDDNSLEGPDHGFSMTPTAFAEMVSAANQLHTALGDGVKRIEANEEETAIVQRRGLYYTANLPAGHLLREEDMKALRPVPPGGLTPWQGEGLPGRRLVRPVIAEAPVLAEDTEP